jgi:CRP/FNR family transcriptional regulator, anaerobic regulatory protein
MTEAIKLRALPEAHCKDCTLSGMCLPLALEADELELLDSIVKRGKPLKKGEMLFRQGDPDGDDDQQDGNGHQDVQDGHA